MVAVLILLLFAAGGIYWFSSRDDGGQSVAAKYLKAWESGKYRVMFQLLDRNSSNGISFESFRDAHLTALENSTAQRTRLNLSSTQEEDGKFSFTATVTTRVFGRLKLDGKLSVDPETKGVIYSPEMVFPGLAPGEALRRTVVMPQRAKLLTGDGKVLAGGTERIAEQAAAAGQLAVGALGPIPEDRSEHYRALGIPEDASVGVSGLELVFQDRLAGRPGGTLFAGERVLAKGKPRPAAAVKTSLDSELQAAAVAALGGQYGAIVAIDPASGEVKAVAGVGFSGTQPPASTFKIVTAAAALERNLVSLNTNFPVETKAVLDGVELENANGESCGGTFLNSFAHSCNSVFAPLGVKVGAKQMVEMAERFGFNQPPPFVTSAKSVIQPADQLQGELALGSTAIGQGQSVANTLQVAMLAQVVAADGVLRTPTLASSSKTASKRVVSRKISRQLRRAMIAVVTSGTGTSAAIDGVAVAGKTGTAELETRSKEPTEEDLLQQQTTDTEDQEKPEEPKTSAWFTGFAPAKRPKIAVAVLVARGGSGGEVAAPIAAQVIRAALK